MFVVPFTSSLNVVLTMSCPSASLIEYRAFSNPWTVQDVVINQDISKTQYGQKHLLEICSGSLYWSRLLHINIGHCRFHMSQMYFVLLISIVTE